MGGIVRHAWFRHWIFSGIGLGLSLRRQTRIDDPRLDLGLFRDRNVSIVILTGLLSLVLTSTDAGAVAFIVSSMIAGIGYGLSFSLVAEVAVSAVPAERAGAAGSIAETSNEPGNALGITLLGALAPLAPGCLARSFWNI